MILEILFALTLGILLGIPAGMIWERYAHRPEIDQNVEGMSDELLTEYVQWMYHLPRELSDSCVGQDGRIEEGKR